MCLAVPGQVQEIYEAHGTRMGKVNFGGVVKEVCLAYVPEVGVGDFTIVHVGVALNKIDEESARETLRLFDEMGILAEEMNAGPPDGGDAVGDPSPPPPSDIEHPRPAGQP
ncbi:MAG: HypC/HybG/HupF family hydrogenase formation chaperone [Isosphaeraceae bacterium]